MANASADYALMLLFGPCIINALMSFVQKKIRAIKLLVLHAQYNPLQQESIELAEKSRIWLISKEKQGM